MRHVLIVASLVLALGTAIEPKPAFAQSAKPAPTTSTSSKTTTPAAIAPSKRLLIDQLLAVTQQEKLFQQTLNLSFSQLQQDLPAMIDQGLGTNGTSKASPERVAVQSMLDRVMPKFVREVQQSISFKELAEQIYYPMYDRHFSEGELKDILAFYQSPTGKRTIQVMPQLVQESLQATNRIMLPKLMGIMQRLMAEEEKNSTAK
jgi:uncharacterized protein